MRAMVVLIFVWGTIVSTTPGVVDRYFSNAPIPAQQTASSDRLLDNAAVDTRLVQRAGFVGAACRIDDSGVRSAILQSAVYSPTADVPGDTGAARCR